MQGNVSFQPATVNDFSAAEANYPLTSGDRLYTDNGALAELEIGNLATRPIFASAISGITVYSANVDVPMKWRIGSPSRDSRVVPSGR